MRAMTGWRFLLSIVLPLFLAAVGAMGLTFDLLHRVETSGNETEHKRNTVVLTEALYGDEATLGRLASENARWSDAALKTAGPGDKDWFYKTWGSAMSIGTSYDIAAVADIGTGKILSHTPYQEVQFANVQDLAGLDIAAINAKLGQRHMGEQQLEGFAVTASGPAIVAVAPIINPGVSGVDGGRLLIFVKILTQEYFATLEKRLLVSGIQVEFDINAAVSGISLSSLDDQPAFGIIWQDRDLGHLVTLAAWSKASAVLGFLILVMTGIGLVCWRLVQQLVFNEEAATFNALHDPLTGFANRKALMEDMKLVTADDKTAYAVAYADLDGFKEVNDSYGHEYGDRLICMVAAGLKELAQDARLCCRLGGDEFVILFDGENAEGKARTFATRLIHMLAQPFDMDGRLAGVGASVGIATNPGNVDEAEILRRADISMYRAKADGRNRFCVYDESFDDERTENLSIAAELKTIIEEGAIEVVFQPVMNAKTCTISGVEVLARWPATSARKVPADRFIMIAEKSGLIDDLSAIILEKACVAAQRWPQLRLAVNVSAVQLNNPDFVRKSLATLAAHGIPANRVEFEITETSLINDTGRAKAAFKTLQQAGIKLALDDFGTGFSSIGYLRTFHFDRIKLDKSITSKLLTSPEELAIVQGTLLVARGLSADVTAEGVENEDEVKILQLAGCTELQGYYFHRPMPAQGIADLVARKGSAPQPRAELVA